MCDQHETKTMYILGIIDIKYKKFTVEFMLAYTYNAMQFIRVNTATVA